MRKKAFTLVEVLVVVSVTSLLVAVLMPVLGRARQQGKAVLCLSNLHQMTVAAQLYAANNDEHYPIAYANVRLDSARLTSMECCWDFATTKDWSTVPPAVKVEPGLLWRGSGFMEIQQCPGFRGPSNTSNDPYTGYNYNTSYIGRGAGESIKRPARTTEVKRPSQTALFGDGQVDLDNNGEAEANKYMRAPFYDAEDAQQGDAQFSARYAGTQGYRHLGQTNVAFCDGHARSWSHCYKNTDPENADKIAEGTGFLSPDNSIYDLK